MLVLDPYVWRDVLHLTRLAHILKTYLATSPLRESKFVWIDKTTRWRNDLTRGWRSSNQVYEYRVLPNQVPGSALRVAKTSTSEHWAWVVHSCSRSSILERFSSANRNWGRSKSESTLGRKKLKSSILLSFPSKQIRNKDFLQSRRHMPMIK